MKKTIAITLGLLAFALAVPAARADLLYFLVDAYSSEGPKYNFDYAMVGVAQKNDKGEWETDWGTNADDDYKVYLQIQATADSGVASSDTIKADNSGTYSQAGKAWADVSDYKSDDYAFYIETYDAKGQGPIWGFDEETAKSYSQLLAAGHIYTDSTSLQNVTAWVIPEPTSGMLLLLGLAGLALRRRRSEVEGQDVRRRT